jgi:hypothetical protein
MLLVCSATTAELTTGRQLERLICFARLALNGSKQYRLRPALLFVLGQRPELRPVLNADLEDEMIRRIRRLSITNSKLARHSL